MMIIRDNGMRAPSKVGIFTEGSLERNWTGLGSISETPTEVRYNWRSHIFGVLEAELILGGLFRVSEEDLVKVDAPAAPVRVPAEAGGGYLAGIEGMHQLHCLNLVRMYTYEDYYKTRAREWGDSAETLRMHVGSFYRSPTLQTPLTPTDSRSLYRYPTPKGGLFGCLERFDKPILYC